MDIFAELQNMAIIAQNQVEEQDEDTMEITRWQELFGYNFDEAKALIRDQRNDLSPRAVSDDHWQLVQVEKEAMNFSREAYEHSIVARITARAVVREHIHPVKSSTSAHSSYLVRLEGKLDTAKAIQEIIGSLTEPKLVKGVSEDHHASFCQLDGFAKYSLEQWLLRENNSFRPMFIQISKASKNLAADSIHPTIGKDATLPQYRLHVPLNPATRTAQYFRSMSQAPLPLQDEYPVWFFFYGTLADPDVLSRVLSLSDVGDPPDLIPASISGATMTTWNGKYKALVDGPPTRLVYGSAFKVLSEEQEDALRFYETDAYEIVRCLIHVTGRELLGLTFRFVGC